MYLVPRLVSTMLAPLSLTFNLHQPGTQIPTAIYPQSPRTPTSVRYGSATNAALALAYQRCSITAIEDWCLSPLGSIHSTPLRVPHLTTTGVTVRCVTDG